MKMLDRVGIALLGATALIAIVAFSYFVWPTPWEYTRQYPFVNRVLRSSGVMERSSPTGWKSFASEDEVWDYK